MPRILVVSNDLVQQRMAGPAIRAYELTRQLAAAGLDVTLATPGSTDLEEPSFRLVAYDDAGLRALADEHDVLLVQGWVIDHHHWLRDTTAAVVVDLYDPFPLEGLVHFERKDATFQLAVHENTLGVMNEQIRHGDFFLCASERQRDYWLGVLTALNRINPTTYAADPTLRNLIDLVPFGIPDRPPVAAGPAMRGVIPGISTGDLILLWGGGIYDWFDPLTLVRGVALAARQQPSVRLLFHAARHPNPVVPEMAMIETTRRLAVDLDLVGTHVFFNEEWIAYERRSDWLLEADVGVTTHLNHVETAYSFRTRVLDYLWAGLPILCTAGDILADEVTARGLGVAVPPGDPDAVAEAIVRLGDADFRAGCSIRVRELAGTMTWAAAAGPLVRYCSAPWRSADKAAYGCIMRVPMAGSTHEPAPPPPVPSTGLQGRLRRLRRRTREELSAGGTRALLRGMSRWGARRWRGLRGPSRRPS